MRDHEQVRQAIAIVGASFVGPGMRQFVWGGMELEAMRAWAAFSALGWAAGADDSEFTTTLEYVTQKLQQYTEGEGEKTHAR